MALEEEPLAKQTPEQRSALGKLFYEYRYLFMYRRFATHARVADHGRMAGRWGKWSNKCPFKAGNLRHAWLVGWQEGREEFEKNRPPKKPPRGGPNGGRRVRRVA